MWIRLLFAIYKAFLGNSGVVGEGFDGSLQSAFTFTSQTRQDQPFQLPYPAKQVGSNQKTSGTGGPHTESAAGPA